MNKARVPVIALVGQPNCGKSTLYNAVAGYQALESNYPGTSVSITKSRVRIHGEALELVDIPGTYSLAGCENEEKVTLYWLLEEKPDLIINIIDASMLGRSLELTLELIELKAPVIICLNMIDEAKRKGIEIDIEKLSRLLGLPVVGTIARKGEGIDRLFDQALILLAHPNPPSSTAFSDDVEQVAAGLKSSLNSSLMKSGLPERFFLLKLLENNPDALYALKQQDASKLEDVRSSQKMLQESHGREAGEVICSERHALALNLFEKVAKVRPRGPVSVAERIDFWLMHKYLGYFFMMLILFGLFAFVFWAGKLIETPLIGQFSRLQEGLTARLGQSLARAILVGLVQGFAGGVGIVLPYLVPFLLGLGILEDTGYLPRAAFLMDSFMHKIGLHGQAVVPFVLSYGCNVPALMVVRTMENKRDRFITAILTTMIPCSARTTIIFGLAAFLLGPEWALLIYFFNLALIALIGNLLTRFMPDTAEGMIMEVPTYKMPVPKLVVRKIWFRLREFIVVAWPILIVGSIILSLMEFFQLDHAVNRMLAPMVVTLLGLPEKVGVTLVFGVLRKELTLVMLSQAIGTANFLSVMTRAQIVVFVIFVVFYIPCLSTLSVLWRILGWKGTIATAAFTLVLAIVCSMAFRGALALIGY